jgi:hypothetical protein
LPTTLSCTTDPVLMNLLLEMRGMMKVLDQKFTTKTDPLSFTIDSIKREIKEYFSKFNKCIKLLNGLIAFIGKSSENILPTSVGKSVFGSTLTFLYEISCLSLAVIV